MTFPLVSAFEYIAQNCFPYYYAKMYYKKRTGRKLNYKNPQDFNEKLFWLQRYWRHPLVTECADKYLVRKYVENKGFSYTLNELYGVYENTGQIKFEKLPNQFVLKCTHGCGYNIFCDDKSKLDLDKTRAQLNAWLNSKYGKNTAEFHYQAITPKIICEKYLQDKNHSLLEYQLFCINGKPQFFLARNDLGVAGHNSTAESYSLRWERIDMRRNENLEVSLIKKPKNIDLLLNIATKLSEPFPQVRVDFYEANGDLVFGELTFSTSGNVLSNYKDDVVFEMGKKLILPEPIK